MEHIFAKMKQVAKAHLPDILLVVSFTLAAGWFYNGAHANQASRLDMILSFVEPGPDQYTFRIDQYVRRADGSNTCDWANNPAHDDHLYSNKAPGPALMGIPVYYVLYHLEFFLGLDPHGIRETYINFWLLNLILTVFPVAFSSALFYRFLINVLEIGTFQGAWWLTVGLYFCTLAFPFSTQLWGHTIAMALGVAALYFAGINRPSGPVISGCIIGAAVLSEYSAPILVVGLGIWVFMKNGRNGFFMYLCGGLPMLFIFMAYHMNCFGSPFHPATSFNNPAFLTKGAVGGLFQLGSIFPAAWGITFSSYRGLFWFMPVTILLLPSLFVLRTRWWKNPLLLSSMFIILCIFLMNLLFNGWHAGWSSGPRYLIIALPFFFIVIALAWKRARSLENARYLRGTLFIVGPLMLISFSNMFVTASVTPMAFEDSENFSVKVRTVAKNPLKYFYILIARGRIQPMGPNLSPFRGAEVHRVGELGNVFNVGNMLGLKRGWTLALLLVPLLGILCFGAYGAWSGDHATGRDD